MPAGTDRLMLQRMILSPKVHNARPWRSLLAVVAAMPLAGLAQEPVESIRIGRCGS